LWGQKLDSHNISLRVAPFYYRRRQNTKTLPEIVAHTIWC
jgi:hypothetical protein